MGNAALQQLLQFFVNKADLRAKNDLAGRGGGADHTGSPGGFECLFVHLSAVFQLEAQPCGAAAGFLHIGLTAQRSQNVGGDAPAWSRSAFTTPSFSASFFFCSAALLVERATKEADNRGHSQQHRDHDPNLGGGGGQGNAAGNHGGAQNQGQHQKAGDRQMRWNEFMLQSTSLGSVFLPLRQTRRRHL